MTGDTGRLITPKGVPHWKGARGISSSQLFSPVSRNCFRIVIVNCLPLPLGVSQSVGAARR